MDFSTFKEHSVAEFFKKNRHMLGFSGKVRSLTTIVHEYVTNALDAAEEAGILPHIRVSIREVGKDEYIVRVQDNGPGIPKELIGKALGKMLAGTKFHRYIQQRGQQGIGAAGCTMYALLTTGKPIHVVSGHNGRTVSCDVSIDFKTNEPIVTNVVERESPFRGLIVEGRFGNVKYERSQYGPLEYLKRTAIANPHATIELLAPDGKHYRFERSVSQLPPRPREVKPHPLGLEPYDLLELAKRSKAKSIASFLENDLSRVSAKKVEELRSLVDVDLSKPPSQLTWEEAKALVKAIRSMKWMAPPLDAVIPIGGAQIEKSLNAILKPEFLAVVERRPKVYRGGIPFVVEAAVAYGSREKQALLEGEGRQSGRLTLMRFANRAPLLFDTSACAITQTVQGLDWKRYGVDPERDPLTVLVNISSVHVPYVSAGKQAIADEEEVVSEIKLALQEAARKLKLFIGKRIRSREREKRRKALMRYVKHLSHDLASLAAYPNPREIEERLIHLIDEKFGLAPKGEEKDVRISENISQGEG